MYCYIIVQKPNIICNLPHCWTIQLGRASVSPPQTCAWSPPPLQAQVWGVHAGLTQLYVRSGPSQSAVHIVLSNFVTSWFVFSLCISEWVSGAQQCLSSSSYSWSLFSSAPTTMSQNAGKSSTDAGSHSLSRISHLEVGTIGNCLFCPMGHFPSNTG